MAKTLEIPCPNCQQSFVVGVRLAGCTVHCPHCRESVAVPGEACLRDPAAGEATKDVEPVGNERHCETGPLPDAASRDGMEPSTAEENRLSTSPWFLRIPEGMVYGPMAYTVLRQWVADGRVDSQCEVSNDQKTWRSANTDFPELAAPVDVRGSRPVVEQLPEPLEPSRGGWVLALAVLGWLTLCPLFAAWAWLLGLRDMRRIRQGKRSTDGKLWTIAGMRLATLEFVILGVLLGAVVLAMSILSLAY